MRRSRHQAGRPTSARAAASIVVGSPSPARSRAVRARVRFPVPASPRSTAARFRCRPVTTAFATRSGTSRPVQGRPVAGPTAPGSAGWLQDQHGPAHPPVLGEQAQPGHPPVQLRNDEGAVLVARLEHSGPEPPVVDPQPRGLVVGDEDVRTEGDHRRDPAGRFGEERVEQPALPLAGAGQQSLLDLADHGEHGRGERPRTNVGDAAGQGDRSEHAAAQRIGHRRGDAGEVVERPLEVLLPADGDQPPGFQRGAETVGAGHFLVEAAAGVRCRLVQPGIGRPAPQHPSGPVGDGQSGARAGHPPDGGLQNRPSGAGQAAVLVDLDEGQLQAGGVDSAEPGTPPGGQDLARHVEQVGVGLAELEALPGCACLHTALVTGVGRGQATLTAGRGVGVLHIGTIPPESGPAAGQSTTTSFPPALPCSIRVCASTIPSRS